MAKFTNDLSTHLDMVQHEEILESINNKYIRQSKEMALKVGIFTGATVASCTIGIVGEKPELILITMASLAIANSVYNIFIQRKQLKTYKIDYSNLNNIDYRKIAISNREQERYNGKLSHKAAYRYEKENPEYIEEEFGHPSDNDLPIQFLEQHLVPERVLHEYNQYSKRYEVPELKISEDDLVEFVNKLSELLKKVHLSHRIYYYTSEYFKHLIAKGLINYWEEINMNTLLSHLDIFKGIDLTEEDLKEFIRSFKDEEIIKKLK